MYRNFYLLITLLIICGCSFVKNKRANTAVEVYSCLQFIDSINGEKTFMKDSVSIYKYANYIVYKVPTSLYLFHGEQKGNSDTVIQRMTGQVIRFKYFVYQTNQLYGNLYDSIGVTQPKRVLVDSIERNAGMKWFPIYWPEDSLVSTKKQKLAHLLLETRIPKVKKNKSFADSLYYYYSNEFIGAPYSFSNYLDSSRNLKLFKFRALFKEIEKGKLPTETSDREFLFELRKAKSAPEISKLIERVKSSKTKS